MAQWRPNYISSIGQRRYRPWPTTSTLQCSIRAWPPGTRGVRRFEVQRGWWTVSRSEFEGRVQGRDRQRDLCWTFQGLIGIGSEGPESPAATRWCSGGWLSPTMIWASGRNFLARRSRFLKRAAPAASNIGSARST